MKNHSLFRKLSYGTIIGLSLVCTAATKEPLLEQQLMEPRHNVAVTQEKSLLSLIDTSTEKKITQSSLYLKAMFLQQSGKFPEAQKMYEKLFSNDAPSSVYDGYLRFLSETNQFEKITALIDKTQEQFKDNIDIQIIYAQSLLNTDKDKQAEELLAKLKEKNPDNEQIAYYTATQHEKTNNLTKALEVINSFIKNNPQRSRLFLFYFLQAKIYVRMNNFAKGLESINESLKLFSGFDKGYLLKALICEHINNIAEAIHCYKLYLSIISEDQAVSRQMIQLLFMQNRFTEAATEFKKIKLENTEDYFNLALLELKSGNGQGALSAIDQALKYDANSEKVKLLKTEILLSINKYKEAVDVISSWLTATPSNNELIQLMLTLQTRGITATQILQALEPICKANPKNYALPVAIGDLYLGEKQFDKAVHYYQKAKALVNKKDDISAQLTYQIAFVLYCAQNKTEALSTLEKGIKEKYVHPSMYNLLAYIYAESGENLDKALLLIEKAIATDSSSEEFLDTKGFILYKQGKYQQAIEVFTHALFLKPNDPVIKEHLAHANEHR